MDTAKELFAGGLANATASIFLNWSDVIKIRLQTQETMKGPPMYRSFSQALSRIVKEEGLVNLKNPMRGGLLMPGMVPSIMREFGYSSFRFGCYPIVKRQLGAEGNDIGLTRKIAAGLVTGGLGSALATPTDLVKIRQQREAGRLGADGSYETGLHKGSRPQYRHTGHAFRAIFSEHGVRGLYRGIGPTMFRASMIASGQLASYDHTKHTLKTSGLVEDGVALHVFASVVAGLCATTAAQPFDTIKSRVMADLGNPNTRIYSGMFDCLVKSVRQRGIMDLYTGWLTSYLRLGPHFIIAMPLWEQCRALMGLGYL